VSGRPTHPVRRVVLSLGSNLGNRLEQLQGAVDALADTPDLRVLAVSPVYETDPVGGPEQSDYLNAVVVAEAPHSPRTLLERALAVERAFDRVRDVRWGPRTLDVDLVAVGDLVVDEPDLQVPHPRAGERAFVLVPWLDVDAAADLPGAGRVAGLVEALDVSGVRRRDDLDLVVPS
jgi:2-amino-4-hydroxy-6-hydroxymethyldihydropteridine diphosphokinase